MPAAEYGCHALRVWVGANKNLPTLSDLRWRGVTLCLITLCYSSPNVGLFDHVIRLSSREYSNVGIHPMKVLVEYMMRRALVVSAEEWATPPA